MRPDGFAAHDARLSQVRDAVILAYAPALHRALEQPAEVHAGEG
jgi:hypothetical protein